MDFGIITLEPGMEAGRATHRPERIQETSASTRQFTANPAKTAIIQINSTVC